MNYKKRNAATTIQNCIIMLILTAVVSFFVVFVMNKYQEKLFEIAYQTAYQKISGAIDTLIVTSGNSSIADTIMYSETQISDYSQTSGQFLKEYIGIYKNCGNSNDTCFAKKYTTSVNLPYNPDFEGFCAILNNGEAICLKPQIGENDITGIIDINGIKGPNVLGKDLRAIKIDAFKTPKTKYETPTEINVVNF